jgi:hypothetical protein
MASWDDAVIDRDYKGRRCHKAGGAQRRPGNNANPLIMSNLELSAAQSMRMTKVNEFADDDKTKGADRESAICACLQYKSK